MHQRTSSLISATHIIHVPTAKLTQSLRRMSNDHVSDTYSSALSSKLTLQTPSLTRASAVTVAVDPVALVVTECITVTSAMRKHARWAHSSVSAILGGSTPKPSPTRRVGKVGNAAMLEEEDAVSSRWGLKKCLGEPRRPSYYLVGFPMTLR